MDEYMMTLVCRALINISGDLAVRLNQDPDMLVEQALLDASLSIRRHTVTTVQDSIRRHHPRLYDKAFTIEQGIQNL